MASAFSIDSALSTSQVRNDEHLSADLDAQVRLAAVLS
jgi:hypothetical protein